MAGQVVTHVLLDFFGTLVRYSPSRTEQGYHASHALAASMGARVDYQGFLQAWAAESALFDERSAVDDSEFSIEEVGEAFLSRVAGLMSALADRFRLAVVTNTHKADLVPGHLSAMGIAHHFDAVVTSVELGWRKPHPAIYSEALLRLGATPDTVVFAGDSYLADYLGPISAGLTSFLIDPAEQHSIPPDRRLRSLHDLPVHLGVPYVRPHGSNRQR